jgi:hypothetical protein
MDPMEHEYGRIQKSNSVYIVVKKDNFGGTPGITIREYMQDSKYTGFTKSGTRIPIEKWDEFLQILSKVQK